MESLGINLASIIINTILFTMFVAILYKFLFTKLANVISDRQKHIDGMLAKGESATKALEEANESVAQIMHKTKQDAANIILEAKKEAEEEQKKVIIQAKKEASQILDKAKELAQSRQEELESKMETEITNRVKIKLHEILKDNAEIIDIK